MYKHWCIVTVFSLGVLWGGDGRAEGQDGGLASELPLMEPILVAPFTPLREVRDALRQSARFQKLPAQERALVSNDFYLYDENARRFVSAGPESGVVLQAVTRDGLVRLRSESSGQVHVPGEIAGRGWLIEINARGRYALRSRPNIRYLADSPPTIAQLNDAADQYFQVYKAVYAGRLFKAFIGSRNANCITFLFLEPSVVNVMDAEKSVFASPRDTSVTIFRSDLEGLYEKARVVATSQPIRVGACLLERKDA